MAGDSDGNEDGNEDDGNWNGVADRSSITVFKVSSDEKSLFRDCDPEFQ